MLKKVIIGTFAFFFLVIGIVLLWVYFNGDVIKQRAIETVNNQLDVPVKVNGSIDITFISSFPKLSLVLNDVFIPDKLSLNDTLAQLGTVRVSFNLIDILRKNYTISSISLENGLINLKTDINGNSNYNILKKNEHNENSSDIHLSQISLRNIDFNYINVQDGFSISNFISDASFSGSFYEKSFLIKTDLNTMVKNMNIDGKGYFENRDLKGSIELSYDGIDDCIYIKRNKLEIDGNFFEISGSFCVTSKMLDLKANAKGNDLRKALNLLPLGIVDEKDFSGNGNYEIYATIIGATDKPLIDVQFSLKNANASIKDPDLKIEKLNFSGSYNNQNELLIIDNFSLASGKSSLSGNAKMLNNNFTDFQIALNGSLDYNTLNNLLGNNTTVQNGTINLHDFNTKLKQSKIDSLWRIYSLTGNLDVSQLEMQVDGFKDKLTTNAQIKFSNKLADISKLNVSIGKNDLAFEGSLNNYLTYIQSNEKGANSTLQISGKIESNLLNINDLIIESSSNASSKKGNEIKEPFNFTKWLNMEGNINLSCKKLIYLDAEFNDVSTSIFPSKNHVFFRNIIAFGLGGIANGDMSININSKNEMKLILDTRLKNMDINQVFLKFRNFDQTSITASNLKGRVDADILISALWNSNFDFVEEAFTMQAKLDLRNGELIKLESLKALSGKLSEEQLANIVFTDMSTTVSVANRVIYIPKTQISSNILQMDVSGSHSFDNMIDYSMVLNLKNLLAAKFRKNKTLENEYVNDTKGGLNLYISMKGHIDNLKISFDKESVRAKIKEDFKQEKSEFKSIFKKEEKTQKDVKSEDHFYYDKKKPEEKYLDWEED